MNWLQIATFGFALVIAFTVGVLTWFVFEMSYTLNQMLILLKDQHDTRCEGAAKASAIRTKRHDILVTQFTRAVDLLRHLGDIAARFEPTAAIPEEDRKTVEMSPALLAPRTAEAAEQPPTVREQRGHGPVMLPEPPAAPCEPARDSEVETRLWSGPPSGTLVALGAVPAK